ncbi:anoctamin-5 isoform X2 [Culicoides brevitarsis]|uniref:anoctamin-5 isoform X2 n=1 Tax=Culicoides brevitarsis TaxID=469753 RepID=UPI00307BACA4
MSSDTDRDSIYLDTLSMQSGSTNYNNRKSIALSQQTIYHSTEDLPSTVAASATLKGYNNDFFLDSQKFHSDIGLNDFEELDSGDVPLRGTRPRSEILQEEVWRTFTDGERNVDFVLSYPAIPLSPGKENANEAADEKRQLFCANLEKEGLELEYEKTQSIHFVKIHAPKHVLCKYAELLKWEMPIKRSLWKKEDVDYNEYRLLTNMKSFFGRPFRFVKLDPVKFPHRPKEMYHEFSRDKDYLFDIDDKDFFTQDVRIAVVSFILERCAFTDEPESSNACVGIQKLLDDKIYKGAYPLHDGDPNDVKSKRGLLLAEWASISKWIRHQPLTEIKEYFGAHIALYFAWLGFYTHMLIPASIFGIIVVLFGLSTMFSNNFSKEICSENRIMCPQCDRKCDYWNFNETCVYSRLSNLFDNQLTFVWAVFMSIWATLYLELWQRYSASLIHSWGLTNYTKKTEPPRPQYLARLKNFKDQFMKNRIQQNVEGGAVLEPAVPFWRFKFPRYLVSYSIIFLFICLAVSAVFGVILYRMSLNTAQNIYGNQDSMTYKITVLPVTAACINLFVITVLNYVYDYLAVILTNMEMKRTQAEFDESLSLKIYLFQFINYYSSIFYIAFIKGKFPGYPAKYNRIFGLRQEECNAGNCMFELCIQLVIIMVGKQIMNSVMEMTLPILTKTLTNIWNHIGVRRTWSDTDVNIRTHNQWTEDYKLLPWQFMSMFSEYLEMVIQYGFITLFVVAFPLAPFFALLNNVFEMRLDAKKFLLYYRRAVPKRVRDIGSWYGIMQVICRLSVMSNAFIIAFSSNFIPELVYSIYVKKELIEPSYLNFTLARFDVNDFEEKAAPLNSSFENVTICHYTEFRNPPEVDPKYKKNQVYWHVLAARLAFIVVFQNVVGLVQLLVDTLIPDVPRRIRERIKREDYLLSHVILDEEKRRYKKDAYTGAGKKIMNVLTNIQNGKGIRKRSQQHQSQERIHEHVERVV